MLIFLQFGFIQARFWPDLPISLFPNGAPGNFRAGKEKYAPGIVVGGSETVNVYNVSEPTITVYRAPETISTGSAVVVLPAGGYRLLVIDKEGEEICNWLIGLGITAVLLKYRVSDEGLQQSNAAFQDAQRAIGYLRSHADEYSIDPQRIGVIGFSAGGHLAVKLSNNFDSRSYEPFDDADKESSRPDFSVLVYPSYLSDDLFQLASDITVNENAPPTLLVQAEDDDENIDSSIFYYYALKNVGIPSTIHLYDNGGHGFGIRESSAREWTLRAENWLEEIGALKTKRAN